MITFPANFLPKPQLFFIAEHNISKKFPMLDIYPYLKGRGDLKIKLAEVNKGSNNHPQNQVISSIKYSEITSSNTRVINGSDTPNTAVLENKSLWLRLLNILKL